jgi:hypothetical protein
LAGKFVSISILASRDNSDAFGAKILGVWNEWVKRKVGSWVLDRKKRFPSPARFTL